MGKPSVGKPGDVRAAREERLFSLTGLKKPKSKKDRYKLLRKLRGGR